MASCFCNSQIIEYMARAWQELAGIFLTEKQSLTGWVKARAK